MTMQSCETLDLSCEPLEASQLTDEQKERLTETLDRYLSSLESGAPMDSEVLLDEHPDMWREIREGAEQAHEPGRFVSLLAYEWTSWIHGHRHVVYFENDGEVYSSLSTEYETPQQLWAALAGQPALTFAHHSAGGPIPTNWDVPPDPVLEPVTEIVSVHGSSEAPDSPQPIYNPVRGNFVRDVLERGYRLGFVGSGDGHDGHPGLAHINAVSGGLAAILSEELTREAVHEAMKFRRVYATNGPRILLQVSLAGAPMGSTLEARVLNDQGSEARRLVVRVVAPGPLQQMDLIRSGEVIESVACAGASCSANLPIAAVQAGEYLYLRVLQTDGGAAWSSPYFFR